MGEEEDEEDAPRLRKGDGARGRGCERDDKTILIIRSKRKCRRLEGSCFKRERICDGIICDGNICDGNICYGGDD